MTRSNVVIESRGDSRNTAVFVDGEPMDGVTRVDWTITVGDNAKAVVHLILPMASLHVDPDNVEYAYEPTPIYDALASECCDYCSRYGAAACDRFVIDEADLDALRPIVFEVETP